MRGNGLLHATAWLTATLLVVVLRVVDPESTGTALLLIGVLGISQCASAFMVHGGRHITAPGIFLLACALFIYFPSVVFAVNGSPFDDRYQFTAAVLSLVAQLLMYYIWWRPARPDRGPSQNAPDHGVLAFSFWIGTSLIAGGMALDFLLGLGPNTLAGAASYLGVVLVAYAVLSGSRVSLLRTGVVLVAVGAYVLTMFTGGGRLVLGGLAVTIILIVNLRWPARWQKAGTLFAVPIGLIALTSYRSAQVSAAYGANESGYESVVWPFARFAQLVGMAIEDTIELQWGETFYAAMLSPIPRAIWPDKPLGLGAELTALFRPELIGTGHSEAALLHGEFVVSLGIAGLALMVLVTGWLVRAVDLGLAKWNERPLETRRDLFLRVSALLLASGFLDLVWVGSFTFATRTGQRLALLALIFVLFMWHVQPKQFRRARGPIQVEKYHS